MKNKKNKFFKKTLIFLILITGLTTMGVSYASWNLNLHIETKTTTGIMDILFSDSKLDDYKAKTVDLYGNAITNLNVKINLEEEGKLAKVDFKDPLPINELINGNLLKIELPLEPHKDSSVTNLRQFKLDMSQKPEELNMKANKIMILTNGQLYFLDSISQDFLIDLDFDLFREFQTDENEKNTSYIYLRLKPESIKKIQNLPTTIHLNMTSLNQCSTLNDNELNMVSQINSGIVINYSCEIPVYIDQQEADETIMKIKEENNI